MSIDEGSAAAATPASTTVSTPVFRPRWLRPLVGLLVFSLVLLVAIPVTAALILTLPRRQICVETPADFHMTFEDATFPARGGDVQISGWYIPAPASHRALIMVHGKDSARNREFHHHFVDLASSLHARGFTVLMIDLRGHGRSGPGRFTFGLNEKRDIEGAADYLKSRGIPAGSIGVLGSSMGAASSILATADDQDIGAMVEDSGYAAIYPIIEKEWGNATGLPGFFLPLTRQACRILQGYDLALARPVDEIPKIAPRPMLLIHGQDDTLVPPENGDLLKAAAPTAELWKVAGAGHSSVYNHDPQLYLERVAGFFDRGLP